MHECILTKILIKVSVGSERRHFLVRSQFLRLSSDLICKLKVSMTSDSGKDKKYQSVKEIN